MAEFYHTATDEDRRTLVLALAYQELRREYGEYVVLFQDYDDIQNSRTFRTFATVRRWLETGGWLVTYKQARWFGYMRFVFESMAPILPHPAQLKNTILMEKYNKRGVRVEKQEPIRDRAKLQELYDRIVVNTPDGFAGITSGEYAGV